VGAWGCQYTSISGAVTTLVFATCQSKGPQLRRPSIGRAGVSAEVCITVETRIHAGLFRSLRFFMNKPRNATDQSTYCCVNCSTFIAVSRGKSNKRARPAQAIFRFTLKLDREGRSGIVELLNHNV